MLVETRLVALFDSYLKLTDEFLGESLAQPPSSRALRVSQLAACRDFLGLLLLGSPRNGSLAAYLSGHTASVSAFVSSLAHQPRRSLTALCAWRDVSGSRQHRCGEHHCHTIHINARSNGCESLGEGSPQSGVCHLFVGCRLSVCPFIPRLRRLGANSPSSRMSAVTRWGSDSGFTRKG